MIIDWSKGPGAPSGSGRERPPSGGGLATGLQVRNQLDRTKLAEAGLLLGQRNTDRAFAYGQERDAVGDERYNAETARRDKLDELNRTLSLNQDARASDRLELDKAREGRIAGAMDQDRADAAADEQADRMASAWMFEQATGNPLPPELADAPSALVTQAAIMAVAQKQVSQTRRRALTLLESLGPRPAPDRPEGPQPMGAATQTNEIPGVLTAEEVQALAAQFESLSPVDVEGAAAIEAQIKQIRAYDQAARRDAMARQDFGQWAMLQITGVEEALRELGPANEKLPMEADRIEAMVADYMAGMDVEPDADPTTRHRAQVSARGKIYGELGRLFAAMDKASQEAAEPAEVRNRSRESALSAAGSAIGRDYASKPEKAKALLEAFEQTVGGGGSAGAAAAAGMQPATGGAEPAAERQGPRSVRSVEDVQNVEDGVLYLRRVRSDKQRAKDAVAIAIQMGKETKEAIRSAALTLLEMAEAGEGGGTTTPEWLDI
jgi:hypothetical protein